MLRGTQDRFIGSKVVQQGLQKIEEMERKTHHRKDIAKSLLELKRDMYPHVSPHQVPSRRNRKDIHIYFLKTGVTLNYLTIWMAWARAHQRDVSFPLDAKAGLLKFQETTFWFIRTSGDFREWAEYKSQGLGLVAIYQWTWKGFSILTTSMSLLMYSDVVFSLHYLCKHVPFSLFIRQLLFLCS